MEAGALGLGVAFRHCWRHQLATFACPSRCGVHGNHVHASMSVLGTFGRP
jgi:hypothetical protein